MNGRAFFALTAAALCAGKGLKERNRLCRREETLSWWLSALRRLHEAFSLRGASIPQALLFSSGGEDNPLSQLAKALSEAPSSDVQGMIGGLSFDPLLSMEEVSALKGCLLSLFSPELSCQASAASRAAGQFEEYLNLAAEKRGRLGKTYTSLGFLAGAALFILLI